MGLGIGQAVPIVAITLVLLSAQSVFADSANFTRVDGKDQIAKNPTAQKILDQIELSKKILDQLKSGQIPTKQTEQQKFVEQQRKMVQDKLQKDLNQMHADYDGFTSKNAYAKFLNHIPSQYHDLYWEQFNHLDQKIQQASAAKEQMLSSGASYKEAMVAYYRYAATQKIEMVSVNKDLNIKYGFTDSELQSYFDVKGKLPRYEDSDPQPCFSCQRYEAVAQKMIEDSLQQVSDSARANSSQPT